MNSANPSTKAREPRSSSSQAPGLSGNGLYAEKRLLLQLTAPGMITYTRENGFLNASLSLLFSTLGRDDIEK